MEHKEVLFFQDNGTDWSVETANMIISTMSPHMNWDYTVGLLLEGLLRVYKRTNDQRYLNFVNEWAQYHIASDGSLDITLNSLDNIMPGFTILHLYRETGNERFRLAAEKLRDRFDTYPRTPDGGFWHMTNLEGELWLDGLYMGMPFLTTYGQMIGEANYAYSEAIEQFKLHIDYLMDDETGLLLHAFDYDGSASWALSPYNRSPYAWGRAIGWVMMGMSEILDIIPADFPQRDDMVEKYISVLESLASYQDPSTGLWYQVIDYTDNPDNWLETSCSMMFVFSMQRAIQKGFLDESYQSNVNLGYNGILTKISQDASQMVYLTDICAGTGVSADIQYYFDRPRNTNDNHGLGTFLIMNELVKYGNLPWSAAPYLNVSPTSVSLGSASGSSGSFTLTSNTTWSITENGEWLTVSPVSGTNNATITCTATSANTGSSARSATVTVAGTGITSRTVTVTQEGSTTSKTLGNTQVYSLTSTKNNRRAIPVTFTESGTIQSISICHNGGSGGVVLGVYSNAGSTPSSRLGVTASSTVSSTAGWQTIPLTSAVSVSSGQTVWLAWVFQTNPGIRYTTGTPARAESAATWSGGMPTTFGTAAYANYKYSVYCTYITGTPTPYLNVSPTSVSLGSASGSSGSFTLTSNTTWSITENGEWLTVSPVSGTNNATITCTATSANTGSSARSATVTVAGTGITSRTVTVTQEGSTTSKTLGNTQVYSLTSTKNNRRAIPVTFTESGTIRSISICHNGGSGGVVLGVYSNAGGTPSSRLGVTASSTVSSTAGWQTIPLTSAVSVSSGQTVWLAWVFQTNPGIRYTTGTPARAESAATWSGGMPTTFGTAAYANYKYSVYCTYTTGTPTPYLNVSPTSVSLGSASGSSGSFTLTSNTTWSITENGEWLTVSPVSGTNNATITCTATSANTGSSARSATVTVAGTGITSRTVTVTQEGSTTSKTLGNTQVYSLTSTKNNRRAIPVTFTESGTIRSISICHNGGSGGVVLGIYSNAGSTPSSRLGVTASSTVSSTAGWQTIPLTSAVSVSSGQTVWLAWVFQTNPGIRYTTGTPARAESAATWSGGMPTTFGTAAYANYKYSVYCTYTTGTPTPYLNVSPTSVSLGSASGSSGSFTLTSNTTWSITENGEWLTVSPVSGTNNATITCTATSANTGSSARSATVTVAGTGITSRTVTVTQEGSTTSKTLGNTQVYSLTSTKNNRRAIPVTFTESGTIRSISICHNGGSGGVVLGVYSNAGSTPSSRLGVTASSTVSSTAGWQTIPLTSAVSVSSGQTVWLAWVFQTNPGIRYTTGTPARAESAATWSGGMPTTFGTAAYANYKYSIYCTYTPDLTKSGGNLTEIISTETVEEEVLIYPNPTEGSITVNWKNNYERGLTLTIYNSVGRLMKTVDVQPQINEISIDLRDIKPGIYLLQLKNKMNGTIINASRIIKD